MMPLGLLLSLFALLDRSPVVVRKIFDPLADTLQRALSAKKSLSSEEFKAKVDSLSPDVRLGLVTYIDARIEREKSPELRAQLQALKDDLS